MKPEERKYLYDIWRAVELLTEFTANKAFQDYECDAMLRAAVERQFEIVGEAIAQLARLDQETAGRIGEYRLWRFATSSSMAMPMWTTVSCGMWSNPSSQSCAAMSKGC